jgi:uncharacterized protein (TIGR02145 family)
METNMKALFTFYLSLFTFLSFAQSIEVYDVKQVENNLQVFYNFSGGTGSYTVSLHYSLDNGSTWLGPSRAVSGDVGKGVKPGKSKMISWNVLADREHLKGEALRFKVMAKSEGSCVDIDGNTYQTLQIGTQLWMKENLKTTRYRDGSAIPTNLSNSQWENTTRGAYAIYDNEPENDKIYGKLYNWYAVADPRGLCPVGWHVPSDAEWATLENFLGGTKVAGGKMKTTNSWTSPNAKANNYSGFSGFPGGYRNGIGYYGNVGGNGGWWSSTGYSTTLAWLRGLGYLDGSSNRDYGDKQSGFSLRCLRD